MSVVPYFFQLFLTLKIFSLFFTFRFAFTCSGDIHGGEPEMVLVIYLSEKTFLAVPKSAIFTRLSFVSNRLRELQTRVQEKHTSAGVGC